MFHISDYSYALPKELIAQEAAHPHHSARLMVLARETGDILAESTFWDIDTFLAPDRVLYFNNTRVQKARIRLTQHPSIKNTGEKGTIDAGEILFLEKRGENLFEGLVRPGKKFKIGTRIVFGESGYLEVVSESENGRIFRSENVTIESIMHEYGELPLPPYIEYSKEKERDYQTSFGERDGSVAAPTASLHFTKELLEKLPHKKQFLTLHVGLGTFKGIDTPDIRDYKIHLETVEIDQTLFEAIADEKGEGFTIVGVGTTATRSLESLPHVWKSFTSLQKSCYHERVQRFWENICKDIAVPEVEDIEVLDESIRFRTKIYIYPGIPFRVVDELITNFHLPESSLLVLVGAFMGSESILKAYEKAIANHYRFFSFGDGMYIKKN